MWFCRVVLAMVLARVFHMGPIAVWIGMFTDWTIRGIIYTIRFKNRKWLAHQGDLMFVADDDGSCYTEMYLNDQEII